MKCPARLKVLNITWLLDGVPISGKIDVKEVGRHVLEAHVTYESGVKEIIRKVIDR